MWPLGQISAEELTSNCFAKELILVLHIFLCSKVVDFNFEISFIKLQRVSEKSCGVLPTPPTPLHLPQVLQKNIGLFSFLSQFAQEGYSSEEDSTRKRRRESVGGTECPSRNEVIFL